MAEGTKKLAGLMRKLLQLAKKLFRIKPAEPAQHKPQRKPRSPLECENANEFDYRPMARQNKDGGEEFTEFAYHRRYESGKLAYAGLTRTGEHCVNKLLTECLRLPPLRLAREHVLSLGHHPCASPRCEYWNFYWLPADRALEPARERLDNYGLVQWSAQEWVDQDDDSPGTPSNGAPSNDVTA